jgi:hypothetical protein
MLVSVMMGVILGMMMLLLSARPVDAFSVPLLVGHQRRRWSSLASGYYAFGSARNSLNRPLGRLPRYSAVLLELAVNVELDNNNNSNSNQVEENPSLSFPKDNVDTNDNNNDEDDDDSYEYIEYDVLTESEFIASEWLIGTNWDNTARIEETWVRLAVDPKSAQQIAVWGDGSQGVWKLDVASQFLSISKESVVWGKNIWACTVEDYYYLQGTVRGWKYWTPAAVVGQWQAKRLGLADPAEAGTPPWLEETVTSSSATDEQ